MWGRGAFAYFTNIVRRESTIVLTFIGMKKKSNSVDKYIAKTQNGLMSEFGRLDLPLRLRIHIRNLAHKEGLSPKSILNREIDRYGSARVFDNTLKKTSKVMREERRVRRDATHIVSAYGIFGKKIISNSKPIEGGSPGLGKSSRRL